MSYFGLWWLSDGITQLEAYKATLKSDEEKAKVQKTIDAMKKKKAENE